LIDGEIFSRHLSRSVTGAAGHGERYGEIARWVKLWEGTAPIFSIILHRTYFQNLFPTGYQIRRKRRARRTLSSEFPQKKRFRIFPEKISGFFPGRHPEVTLPILAVTSKFGLQVKEKSWIQ
jgi:hypothetical protein